MSATIDGAAFARLLGDCPVIESLGRAFPVAVEHRPRDLADPRDLPEAMAGAIRAALAAHEGDVLAFLPGWGEIRRTAERLSGVDAEVLPLHGELPPAEQDRAPRAERAPQGGARHLHRRNLAHRARRAHRGGWRLPPRAAPRPRDRPVPPRHRPHLPRRRRAARRPRRPHRAGRGDPALVAGAAPRPARVQDRPEILEAELSGLALDLAAWGAEPASLSFLDPPPAGALAAARALLRDLDALDDAGAITPTGRRMARLGAHPRLARTMLAAETDGERALAADLAALLEERDPIRGRDAPSSIALRLDLLRGYGDADAADRGALHRIGRAAALHRRRLGLRGNPEPEGDAGALLAAGFPDRIAAKRGAMDGAFRLAGGMGARLPATDPAGQGAPARRGRPRPPRHRRPHPHGRPAGPRRAAGPLPRPLRPRGGRELRPPRRRRAGPPPPPLRPPGAGRGADRRPPTPPPSPPPWPPRWPSAACATSPGRTRRGRSRPAWAGCERRKAKAPGPTSPTPPWRPPPGTGSPRTSTAARASRSCAGLDLPAILLGSLDRDARRRLDAALPARIALPAGRTAAVDYARDVPTVEARAQHLYGMAALPPLAGGRVPLQVAVLSPAGRPVAVTGDLAGFWRGGWAEVRKEMRGRYPRHAWPDDPATAMAEPPRPGRSGG